MVDEDCDGTVDEDADASCAEGEVCTADGCLPLTPPDPPPATPSTDDVPDEVGVIQDTGCACQAGRSHRDASGLLAALGILAFALARRRRVSAS